MNLLARHPAAQEPSYSSQYPLTTYSTSVTLSSFPSLPGLQLLPALDGTSLHAHHVLVPVSRAEIWHVGAVRPGVPDDHLIEVISGDANLGLPPSAMTTGLLSRRRECTRGRPWRRC